MSIVYPQYWDHSQNAKILEADFIKKIKILQSHFCREVEIQGEHIQGILDNKKMTDQSQCFGKTMWGQFSPSDSNNMVQLQDYGLSSVVAKCYGKEC